MAPVFYLAACALFAIAAWRFLRWADRLKGPERNGFGFIAYGGLQARFSGLCTIIALVFLIGAITKFF